MQKGAFRKIAGNRLSAFVYHKAHTRALVTVAGVALQEAKVSFRQFFTFRSPLFSFARALKYLAHALARVVLGRSIRVSYSFTGEDRIIEALLKPRISAPGFYVDVGCNDPRFLSNSFLFYRRGWRGICVDANAELIARHRRIRPRDTAVCALVSDEKKPTTFYRLTNSVLSTTEEKFLEGYLASDQKVEEAKEMLPSTLTEILDACGAPAVFDFLSVDVENHDLPVLRSLDFTRYSPKLIVVEATEVFDPTSPAADPISALLLQEGYRFAGSVLDNVYFMRSEG